MSDDLIDHSQAAIDFLHQLSRAADGLDDVSALAVMTDVVGEALSAPVLGLVERAVESLDDLLDLRVQIGNLLFARLRSDNVDELVLSRGAHVSPYGLYGPPPLRYSAELRWTRRR
jgi:hypothetical protein